MYISFFQNLPFQNTLTFLQMKTQNPKAGAIRSDGAGRIAYLGGAVFRHGNSNGGARRHDGALVRWPGGDRIGIRIRVGGFSHRVRWAQSGSGRGFASRRAGDGLGGSRATRVLHAIDFSGSSLEVPWELSLWSIHGPRWNSIWWWDKKKIILLLMSVCWNWVVVKGIMEIYVRSRCAGIGWWLKELWQFACSLGVLEISPLIWSYLKVKSNVVIKSILLMSVCWNWVIGNSKPATRCCWINIQLLGASIDWWYSCCIND